MIINNLETIPGHQIKTHLGLVQGSTVRAKHAGKDFFASIKNVSPSQLADTNIFNFTDLAIDRREFAIPVTNVG